MTAAVGTVEYAANLALSHNGQPEIASINDDTTRARAVRVWFPTVRRALLRREWWNFATGWDSPAADPTPGVGRLKTRYVLPPDCLRVRFVSDQNGFNIGADSWDVESATASVAGVDVEAMVLVTNAMTPLVCLTKDVTLPRLWDDLFLEVFSYELASKIATKVGRSQTTADAHHKMAEDKLVNAAGVDSKEKARESDQQRPTASFVSARSFRSARRPV
jgi:hypothetical protein